MNPKVQDLVNRIEPFLKDQPSLGGSILIDFGTDGAVFIGGDNSIRDASTVQTLTAHAPVNTTIKLSLNTLDELQTASPFKQDFMLMDGEIVVAGDRNLAEKFAKIAQSAVSTA